MGNLGDYLVVHGKFNFGTPPSGQRPEGAYSVAVPIRGCANGAEHIWEADLEGFVGLFEGGIVLYIYIWRKLMFVS